jgi:hypothetical protein
MMDFRKNERGDPAKEKPPEKGRLRWGTGHDDLISAGGKRFWL